MAEESMICDENGKPFPRTNKFDMDLYNKILAEEYSDNLDLVKERNPELKTTADFIRQAFLDGLAKGRKEKWHDLREDPDDLPETSIYLSNYSDVVLRQDGTPVRYDFGAREWIFESRSLYERCEVIVWCKVPRFEEK